MTSPDNILLHLAEREDEQVREIYAQLAARGFPALPDPECVAGMLR